MAAFAESFTPPALPKVLTMVLNPDKQFDTYQIPAGTKLFKSYRKQLSKWTPDQVFPVNGPAYFGFDEPNVSANYGFAFAYKTTQPYELLAIDSQKTLAYLWNLAEESEKVQRALQVCFGFDPDNPDKPQIRSSNEQLDYVLVKFLCENGFRGYAGDYIATDGGGRFHPECVICGDRINVELNREYSVARISGLASPTEKHRDIGSMLADRHMRTLIPDRNKRKSKPVVDTIEESQPVDTIEESQQVDTKRFKKNLFDDSVYDGGAQHKKRTQKRHNWTYRSNWMYRRNWTYRRKQTRSQKKNKSRK